MAFGTVNVPGIQVPVSVKDGGTGQNTAPKALYALANDTSALVSSDLAGNDFIPVGDASAETAKKITVTDLKVAIGLGFKLRIIFEDAFAGKSYSVTGGSESYTGTVPAGLTDIITVGAANTTYKISATAADRKTYSTLITTGPKEGQYEAELRTVHIYGASWDGTSTTKWMRTDEAAGFTDPVPYMSSISNYGSPFDSLQPWSSMVKSERAGGTMVAIPKFWYKLTQNGTGMKVQIADKATMGFSVSPAHMDRRDGKGERSVVYIGRYHCGVMAYKSVSGEKPKVSITRSTAYTEIHKIGTSIWQADFALRFTLWLLYIVEFADWDSQTKIGYGCGNNSATENMGYTDSMPYHTGTTQSSRTIYGLGTQYRYIEGLWDNVYDWCDGCYNNSDGLNIILNPNNFSDSANGMSVGVPSNGMPSAFGVKNESCFPLFIPTAAINGSTTTYSCDTWGFDSSSPCICVGGYYDQRTTHGLFYVNKYGVSVSNTFNGCRLQELP